MKVIIFLFFVLFLIGNASAATYYVTHDAPGGGDGSWGTPWTLVEGFSNATVGDTIKIQGGTYSNMHPVVGNSGNATDVITFESDNGTVILDGVDNAGNGISSSKDYIDIKNLELTNFSDGISFIGSDYSNISGCNITSCGSNGISLESSTYNNITNNIVHDIDDMGIELGSGSSNTVISGNYVYDSGWDSGFPMGGIFIDSNDCTISNNTVYGDGSHGICVFTGDNTNISGNTVYSNGYDGIYASGDNINISGNTAYNNGYFGINVAGSADVNLINNFVNNDLGDYFDYGIYSSTGTIVTDTTKDYDTYKIYSSSNSLIIQNGVDYNVSVSEDTVISDNVATGSKSVSLTVRSGTIDQINVSSLSLDTAHYLSHFTTGIVIESQTSDGAGNANFTSDLSSGSYAISDNLYNFTFSNATITPSSVRENESFTVSVDIDDPDGTIIVARVTINGAVYEMEAGAGDAWSYEFNGTIIPIRYEVQQFNARDNDDDWNSTTSDLYIDVQSSSGGGAEPTPEPPEPPSIAPSNGGGHNVKIGETHITIPEFFESPLWEIAIFMIVSLIIVGIYVETGGKK